MGLYLMSDSSSSYWIEGGLFGCGVVFLLAAACSSFLEEGVFFIIVCFFGLLVAGLDGALGFDLKSTGEV